MRTLIILAIGFIALAVAVLIARALGKGDAAATRRAAALFIPFWAAAALYNLWVGVGHGYTVAEELPIFGLIFGLPAAAALVIRWKASSR